MSVIEAPPPRPPPPSVSSLGKEKKPDIQGHYSGYSIDLDLNDSIRKRSSTLGSRPNGQERQITEPHVIDSSRFCANKDRHHSFRSTLPASKPNRPPPPRVVRSLSQSSSPLSQEELLVAGNVIGEVATGWGTTKGEPLVQRRRLSSEGSNSSTKRLSSTRVSGEISPLPQLLEDTTDNIATSSAMPTSYPPSTSPTLPSTSGPPPLATRRTYSPPPTLPPSTCSPTDKTDGPTSPSHFLTTPPPADEITSKLSPGETDVVECGLPVANNQSQKDESVPVIPPRPYRPPRPFPPSNPKHPVAKKLKDPNAQRKNVPASAGSDPRISSKTVRSKKKATVHNIRKSPRHNTKSSHEKPLKTQEHKKVLPTPEVTPNPEPAANDTTINPSREEVQSPTIIEPNLANCTSNLLQEEIQPIEITATELGSRNSSFSSVSSNSVFEADSNEEEPGNKDKESHNQSTLPHSCSPNHLTLPTSQSPVEQTQITQEDKVTGDLEDEDEKDDMVSALPSAPQSKTRGRRFMASVKKSFTSVRIKRKSPALTAEKSRLRSDSALVLPDSSMYPERLPQGIIHPIVVQSVAYLNRESILQEEGLFRIPGDLCTIRKLRQDFMHGHDVDLMAILDPHTVAGLLKLHFRELKCSLIPRGEPLDNIMNHVRKGDVAAVHHEFEKIEVLNIATLRIVVEVLAKISARSSKNMMTSGTLATSCGPSLLPYLPPSNANQITKFLIDNCDDIFKK